MADREPIVCRHCANQPELVDLAFDPRVSPQDYQVICDVCDARGPERATIEQALDDWDCSQYVIAAVASLLREDDDA